MSEQQEASSEGGAPEWMVSYADMITIMMAFFVVLYATTSGSGKNDKGHETAHQETKSSEPATGKGQGDGSGMVSSKEKGDQPVDKVIDSIYDRFGPNWTLANCWHGGARPRAPLPGRPNRGNGNKHAGKAGRGPENGTGIPPVKAGQYVVPSGRICFDETSAALSDDAKKKLRVVADELAGKTQKIELRGHTSRRPLAPDCGYRDHADLAYARSRTVQKYLVAQGVDPRRLRLGIAGENEPVDTTGDTLRAAQNSRVDVHLLNEWIEKEE